MVPSDERDISTLSLLDLPDEVLLSIFKFLPKYDMFWSAGFTCKRLLSVACELNNVIEVDEENKLLGDSKVQSREAERVEQLFRWDEITNSITHLIVPSETSWKLCNQILSHIYVEDRDQIGIVMICKIKSSSIKGNLLTHIAKHCRSLQGLYITNYSQGHIRIDQII